jgi:AraC family transcriptional regulator
MHEPSTARNERFSLTAYFTLTFKKFKGVFKMKCKIEKKNAFTIAGAMKNISCANNEQHSAIPLFWHNTSEETMNRIKSLADVEPIGLLGVMCPMQEGTQTFDYYIAAATAKECPPDLSKLEIPAITWAIFEITGAMPDAIQEAWGQIYSDWFPTSGYESFPAPNIEWYSDGDRNSSDYKTEIWVPVVKK